MSPDNAAEKAFFRACTDRLTESVGPTLQSLAKRMSVVLNSLSRMRNQEDPRGPSAGWQKHLAEEARAGAATYRKKAKDLDELARSLDRSSGG